jgi:hypothetical protein
MAVARGRDSALASGSVLLVPLLFFVVVVLLTFLKAASIICLVTDGSPRAHADTTPTAAMSTTGSATEAASVR